MSAWNPELTIAVVSSRPNLIGRCLESLLSQHMPAEQYEMLVVADYELLPAPSGRVRWIYKTPKSIAAKRNIALREASGSIIAFIDDDCTADSMWAVQGVRYLAEHAADVGVQGKINIPESDSPNAPETGRLARPLYQTSNIFYRRQPVLNTSGFDERFAFQREDVDLGFSLIKNGYSIGYEPHAIVHHPVRKGEYWDLIKTAFRKRYDPLLRKKHPSLFKKYFGRIMPGSFTIVFVCWLLSITSVLLPMSFCWIGPCMLLAAAGLLTLRRHWKTWGRPIWIVASFASYLIAPLLAFAVVNWTRLRYLGDAE